MSRLPKENTMDINVKGKLIKIDDEDYDKFSGFKWSVTQRGYCVAYKNGKRVLLHRLIMPPGDGFFVDHINGNTFDNRKENLRIVSHAQNMRNRCVQRNNRSGYRGVHRKKDGYWYAQIKINGKQEFLGTFKDPQQASLVYESRADEVYGEYRRRQMIDGRER